MKTPHSNVSTVTRPNREDVADVLVRCLATPEATGKTFEVQSLPGFEKVGLADLSRLWPERSSSTPDGRRFFLLVLISPLV